MPDADPLKWKLPRKKPVMEALYHRTNKQLEELHECFSRLETSSSEDAHTIENEIQARIDQITSNCEKLEILVNKEPPSKRPTSKMRLDQLRYDCQHLQAALRNIQHRRITRLQEQKEREELLSRRFAPNSSETSIMIDQALQQNTALQNAHRGMDDLLGSGSSILNNLRDQKQTLKGAHRRMLDVANTLGMSNTVMRLIEKRSYWDKFVLFGLMLITCIIMFLVVMYFW